MRAQFQIIANNNDITTLIKDRVLEISTVDRTGMESDACTIRLDDRDGKVAFPPKGSTLQVSLGWEGQGLTQIGIYTVDSIGVKGLPQELHLSAKPADLRASAKSHRSAGYESTSLSAIVSTLATRHGWQAACSVDANVARADQIGESDLHFVTRLARQYGATAQVKGGKLLVLPRGAKTSASGKTLPAIILTPADVDDYDLTFPDRSSYSKVKAQAHDTKTGKRINVELQNPAPPIGVDAPEHTDRHIYPNADAAQAAAQSRMDALNRKTADGSLNMVGRADIVAEMGITLQKFKAEVDGEYLVESVTQIYAGESWRTTVEINAGNNGKSGVGHKKKGAKKVDLSGLQF
jgi:phage protein D